MTFYPYYNRNGSLSPSERPLMELADRVDRRELVKCFEAALHGDGVRVEKWFVFALVRRGEAGGDE